MVIFEKIVFIILAINVGYLFVYAFGGLFYKERKGLKSQVINRFLILVPAYKEDAVILDTIENLSNIDYPDHAKKVVVLADQLQSSTLDQLKSDYIQMFFEKSTKAKSLIKALNHYAKGYEAVLILDADNHVDPNILHRVNDVLNSGADIIQCHRSAKNLNTPTAILDAANEEINNHIFRKGHNGLGLSSALIGSGMVFRHHMLKKYMVGLEDKTGEDKELEMRLLKANHRVEYLESVKIYDEKVQNAVAFQSQRSRWISTQFYYFRDFIIHLPSALVMGNISFANKIVQTTILPRSILLVLLVVATTVFSFFADATRWLLLDALFITTMIIAVPKRFLRKPLSNAWFQLPVLVYRMLLSIINIKLKDGTFSHTSHNYEAQKH